LKKVINLIFIVVFGWLGWILGEKISFMTAYFFSGFASILGFYLSWMIVRRLVE
jgi:hypothetical protein